MIGRLSIQALALARGGRPLFSGLDLELAAGEAVALTGANGAGKTSLLRAVAGLLKPTAGRVAFLTQDGAQMEPDEARAGALHLLGHDDGLKSGRTAGEELAFWTRWLGGDTHGLQTAEQALELTPLLGLEVRKLSAGQRRRLALARLIAAPRALWLLDEPFAPLDATRSARFGELMREHLGRGGLVLAAVHSPLPVPARSFALASG